MMDFLTTSTIRQFVGFSCIGGGTFLLDLALLYVFTTVIGIHYVIAVPCAFLIVTTIHFSSAKYFIFPESTRSFSTGLAIFIAISIFDTAVITLGTAGLVTFAVLNLYFARTLMAVVSGLLNFFLNARYNFRVL